MVFCPDCGKEVRNAKFCSNCGVELPQIAEEVKNTKFCSNCGSKIDADASVCPDCGFKFNNNVANVHVSVQNTPKSVFVAGLLSFIFPGLGQLYNGQTTKAIYFIIGWIVSAILSLILIGYILMLIVWVMSLIDAVKSTEKMNNGEFVEDKLF